VLSGAEDDGAGESCLEPGAGVDRAVG
jgi:hypothetical protein